MTTIQSLDLCRGNGNSILNRAVESQTDACSAQTCTTQAGRLVNAAWMWFFVLVTNSAALPVSLSMKKRRVSSKTGQRGDKHERERERERARAEKRKNTL